MEGGTGGTSVEGVSHDGAIIINAVFEPRVLGLRPAKVGTLPALLSLVIKPKSHLKGVRDREGDGGGRRGRPG